MHNNLKQRKYLSGSFLFTLKELCKPFDKFNVKEKFINVEIILVDNIEATEEPEAEILEC
jgi:hypothetical protein